MNLTPTLKEWNNKTLNYDLEKYNWPDWALSVIQEVAPAITELETLHKFLSPSEIIKVSRHVQNACSRKDFMEKFAKYFKISGYVQLSRAKKGLLKAGLSSNELGLALTDINKYGPAIMLSTLIDNNSGEYMRPSDAEQIAKTHDIPLVESKIIINLWRSINKIPKKDIASY